MKKRLIIIFLAFILIFLANSAFAFKIGNKSSDIEDYYSPGERIQGWINISFENENGVLTSNSKGNIQLIDFLDANDEDYSCIPTDCSDDYSPSNAETTKTFSLNSQEKIIGMKITGKIQSISQLHFNLSINNDESCSNPLEIDIFDDEYNDWKSKKSSSDYSCSIESGRGCFNVSSQLTEFKISKTPFCEKIKLSSSEKFELGAWVKAGTGNSDTLKMYLYNLNGESLTNCILPEASSSGGYISCNISYLNNAIQDYYICIKSINLDDNKYSTRKENNNANSCGFSAYPGQQIDYYDYDIYAKGAKYSSIGDICFNQKEYESQGNLIEDVKDYIESKYENNCSNGCIIPIKFKSYTNSNIVLSNLNLVYSTTEGLKSPETNFYDIQKIPAKISSGFVILDLDTANITAPLNYGFFNLSLYIDNREIIKKQIEIKKIPIIEDLSPSEILAGIKTRFEVKVRSPTNRSITKYSWDFYSNGTKITTEDNYVDFMYTKIGAYSLSVSVEDEDGLKASRVFPIVIGSPKEVINLTLRQDRLRLDNLTKKIALYPSWYKSKVEKALNIENIIASIISFEKKYASVSSDEDYIKIAKELSSLEVPYDIKESTAEKISVIDYNKINPDNLAELGAGEVDDEEMYKKSIAGWTQENLELKLNFKYITAYYDYSTKIIKSVFSLKITPKEENEDNIYLVIEIENASFSDSELRIKNLEEVTGVVFSDNKDRTVEFVAEGFVHFDELIFYLSPEFSKLGIVEDISCNNNNKCEKDLGENYNNCRNDCKPWNYAIIMIVIVLVLAFIAYIFMQIWYKNKYENYLFKKRNDLYNIINFIKNSRIRGMSDSDTERNLKKVGWSGEQISYAFKKIAGKAILPFDFVKLFKKEEKKTQ